MSFEYDILICHAQPAESKDQQATDWTRKFCELLPAVMQRLYDKKPNILLHENLRSGKEMPDVSPREIYARTAVFVIVLSPDDLQSKEYLDDLEDICRTATSIDKEKQIRHHRVVKVFSKPVAIDAQPDSLRTLPSHHFYEINRYNKKPVTYDLGMEKEIDQKSWSRLVDLAYDISAILRELDPDSAVRDERQKKPGIFLAETTFDQVENRDMLKRELQHLGFELLPILPLPDEAEKAKEAILQNLQQSVLSVHLLGGWYGDFIRNSKYSMIDFQIKTAKDYIHGKTRTAKPEQVIWIPNDLKPTDQRQALYLKRLKRDESQYQTEIIETSFEVFKTALQGRLMEITQPAVKPEALKNKLYVIYEQPMAEQISSYLEMIRTRGFELLEPRHQNGDFYSLTEHINHLLTADAVMIFKGDSTMEWLNSKIRDIIKTPGYGKTKPFRAVEIISPQKTADKSLLFLKNVPVNWDEELSEKVVNHFLEQLVKK